MRYHTTYKCEGHPEGLEQKDVPKDKGACTAVVVASLLYPPDGSFSAAFVSLDGRTGEPLSDAELWKTWTMLAHQLSNSETLGPGKRGICKEVFETVRTALMSLPDPNN